MTNEFDPKRCMQVAQIPLGSPGTACRFDPSGSVLFAASETGDITRIDRLNSTKTVLKGHASWIRGLELAVEPMVASAYKASQISSIPGLPILTGATIGQASLPAMPAATLISSDYHGKLLWWRADEVEPKPFRMIEAHDGWIRSVSISPDGSIIATAGNDKLVRIWDRKSGSLLQTLSGHGHHVYRVGFSPDGKWLVSSDHVGWTKFWQVGSWQMAFEIEAKGLSKYDGGFHATIGGARGLGFSPDSRLVALSGITNVSNAFAGIGHPLIVVMDLIQKKVVRELKLKTPIDATCWGVAIDPSGWIIGGNGGRVGQVAFWKPGETTESHLVPVAQPIRDLCMSSDAKWLGAACSDSFARIFSLG
jgi:WD40 repeat protein